MTHGTLRRSFALCIAVLFASAALASCSDDGGDASDETTTTAEATTDPVEDGDETTTTEAAEGESAELETTDLLEFLQAEDPAIGDLFDWNSGDGVIAITYVGVQTVQLFTSGELDADTAVAACELASDYVFPIDDAAAIEVLAGEYPDGTVVASVEGADGTCAAA